MKKRKTMRGAFALLLSMAILIGLSGTVFAANATWPDGWDDTTTKGSLKITKTAEDGTTKLAGAKYVLYKVANIKMSSGSGQISYTPTTSVAVDTSTTADQFTKAVLTAAKLTAIEGVNTTGASSAAPGYTEREGILSFADLDFGVYLVKETIKPAGVTASKDFLISIPMSMEGSGGQTWVKDVEATPKNAVFDGGIEKKVDTSSNVVVDTDGKNTVDIGAKLSYKITVGMPTDFYGAGTNAKTYTQYEIFDKADAALTVDTSTIKVTIDGTAVKEAGAAGTDPAGYKLNMSTAGQFTISLIKEDTSATPSTFEPYSTKLAAGKEVVVTYTASVNTSATPGTAVSNDAKIKYQYEGGDPGEGEPGTDDPKPEVYTYSHAILKVGDSGAALGHHDAVAADIKAGAQFVVKNSAGKYLHYNEGADKTTAADDYWEWVGAQPGATVFESGLKAPLASVAKDGYIELIGLAGGTYDLIEIKAPEGYSLLDKPVSIAIDKATTATQQSGGYTTKIVNVAGFSLPGTGGAGIYIFIIGGIALIGAALALYGNSRRKR